LPEFAGFGARLLAFAIDWLIFFVVSVPISLLFYELSPLMPLLGGAAAVAFWRRYGATPGKLAVGVRIVDARTGGTPPTGRLVLRLLCYVLSAAPLYLGFLWIAFDRRKQGWHDKIAGTLVIQEDD
jgi:uncharacterized RDD family membrane protein YckC